MILKTSPSGRRTRTPGSRHRRSPALFARGPCRLPASRSLYKTYSKKVEYCLYYFFFAGITAQQKVHGSPIPNQQTDTTVFYRHHQHTFAFLNLKLRSASATSSMLAAATACSVASARAMSSGQKLSMLKSPSKSPPVMCIWCSLVNRMSAQ